MALRAGTRLGPYEIVSAIGAGGMGEVYKATDTRLHRTVAIKVLPPEVSGDAQRKKRFEREAHAVASLNHPHICVLHDVGRDDETDYIVMELLEGETLASRLERGPLPLEQALRFAIQIAAALEKAHGQGLVHRDLKPANIMLTKNGVKLLDFGLVKLRGGGPVRPAVHSATPTMKAGLTGEGAILGTLQYMAPEQLEGQEADARSDIFALGSVIYEMLTGKRAFEATSQASLIAAILQNEPPTLAELQPLTPAALEHLVRVSMAKDPDERWQTAHDIKKQLEWIGATSGVAAAASPSTAPAIARRPTLWIASTLLFLLTTVASVIYFVGSRRAAPAELPMRFSVSMPENVRLTSMLTAAGVSAAVRAISPDGNNILFSGVDETTGKMMLYVRPLDSVDARPLTGTEDAMFPFWSPRSDAVGFFTEGKLKSVAIDGGEPQIICDARISAALSGGGSWNRDDVILAYLGLEGGLYRVSARGGTPSPVTTPEAGDIAHAWPQFLPDGNHFLYAVQAANIADIGIYVGALDSSDRKLVFKGMPTMAVYAHPEHLLFERDGALMIQGFDTRSLELTGAAVRLVENVSTSSWSYHLGGYGAGAFSASETGVIVYRSAMRGPPDRFLWIGRDGKEIGPVLPPGYYRDPALSPDGSRLAFARKESPARDFDIYILELATGKETRLTFDPGNDEGPVWSPGDGSTILYSSSRKDDPGLYRKNANGVGSEELVYPKQAAFLPYQWPMADTFIYFSADLNPQALSLREGKSTPLGVTGADPAISPDGKWLAYFAPEAGRLEMTTYPPSGTRFDVGPAGGDNRWSRKGDALFYVNVRTGELMSVDVTLGNPPGFGQPHRVYAGPLDFFTVHSFDLTPSEDRFIVHTPDPGGSITVLLDWPALIARSE